MSSRKGFDVDFKFIAIRVFSIVKVGTLISIYAMVNALNDRIRTDSDLRKALCVCVIFQNPIGMKRRKRMLPPFVDFENKFTVLCFVCICILDNWSNRKIVFPRCFLWLQFSISNRHCI